MLKALDRIYTTTNFDLLFKQKERDIYIYRQLRDVNKKWWMDESFGKKLCQKKIFFFFLFEGFFKIGRKFSVTSSFSRLLLLLLPLPLNPRYKLWFDDCSKPLFVRYDLNPLQKKINPVIISSIVMIRMMIIIMIFSFKLQFMVDRWWMFNEKNLEKKKRTNERTGTNGNDGNFFFFRWPF